MYNKNKKIKQGLIKQKTHYLIAIKVSPDA